MVTGANYPAPIPHHPRQGWSFWRGTRAFGNIWYGFFKRYKHSFSGENSKSCYHENSIVVSGAENRRSTHSQETGGNEKDWWHRIRRRARRTLERRVLFFREVSRHIGIRTDAGTTPRDGAQVITRWEAQNVIRMCETIILELFTLGLTLSHPGQAPPSVLHLPGGARAVFSQQDISSFATRSLHYRVISFLLFSHQRKYYLFTINIQENMMRWQKCMQIHKKYQSFIWGSLGISVYKNHSVHHTMKDLLFVWDYESKKNVFWLIIN